ncbi:MAG: hypothetical protein ABIO70_27360 [Pseudomonadota bacterium]
MHLAHYTPREVQQYANALVIQYLRKAYIPEGLGHGQKVETSNVFRVSPAGHVPRWVQQGNLFVAIAGKSIDGDMEQEVERVLGLLREALVAWAPPLFQVCLAQARHLLREYGYEADSISLPSPVRQAGWMYHALSSISQEGEIGSHPQALHDLAGNLLQQVMGRLSPQLATFIANALPDPGVHRTASGAMAQAMAAFDLNGREQEILFDLSSFLSTEPFHGEHLTTGTVFTYAERDDAGCIWVCSSPGCDLVPREVRAWDYWRARLSPYIPLVAIRAKAVKISTANARSPDGLFLFIDCGKPRAFSLKPEALPALEQMMLVDGGRVVGGCFQALRFEHVREVAGSGTLNLTEHRFRVLTQLRAPYAERVLQMAGQHLSRIGLDFAPALGDKPGNDGGAPA